jgi:hypothetical protein
MLLSDAGGKMPFTLQTEGRVSLTVGFGEPQRR